MSDHIFKLRFSSQNNTYFILHPEDKHYSDNQDLNFTGTYDECHNAVIEHIQSGTLSSTGSSSKEQGVEKKGIAAILGRFNSRDKGSSIRVVDDRYLGFKGDDIWLADRFGGYEQMYIHKERDDKFSIHNKDGKALGFKDSEIWVSDRVGGYELFEIAEVEEHLFTLKNKSGQYLAVENGELSVVENGDSASAGLRFEIKKR